MVNQPTAWRRTPIIDLCTVHVDCVNRTAPVVREPTPFKMIRTTNVRNGFIDTENVRYVTESVYKKWTRRLVPMRGDVILTREAPLGDVGKVRTDELIFLGQRLYHFRPDPKKLDADFLLYALMAPDLQGQIRGFGSGSTVEHMRLGDIPNLEIFVPEVSIQQRIARVLSAYDDLLANNRQRIEILENMARSLYREWFVHFRFSGHEKIRRVDSSVGPIPHGWEVKPLESLMTDHIGGGWGKETPDEKHTEPAWVIRGTDIPDARGGKIADVPHRFHTASNLRSRCLQAGDILFEVSGGSKGQPVGRSLLVTPELLSAFSGEAVICASFCKRVCPDFKGYGAELLYLSFLEGYESGEIEQFQVQSTGISNFKWTEYIAQTQRVVPPAPLRKRFCNHVAPLLSQIATLGLQASNLRRTRDLLLPRLLTGQILPKER
jgi:type I restriction enzyme, S subunit